MKYRADQPETIDRKRRTDQLDLIEPGSDDAGIALQHRIEIAVATDEVLAGRIERLDDLAFRHRHDATEHDLETRRPVRMNLFARKERLGDHPPRVGDEADRVATCHPECIHGTSGSR